MEKKEITRYFTIDALRGISVILMIEQHLGFWMWKEKVISSSYLYKYPVIITLNALGGVATPIFIMLAGAGSVFFISNHGAKTKSLIIRGIIIVCYGYLLNFLVPSWFSIGSWYMLHMIGFALAISSLLNRISTRNLVFIISAVLLATVAVQIYLDTPGVIGNRRMGDCRMPGGAIRLAIAEGHFPVFPWLAFFITGIITARFYSNKLRNKILYMSLILILSGILLAIPSFMKLDVMSHSIGRVFNFAPRYYPANIPMTLIIMGIAQSGIFITSILEEKTTLKESNFFVNMGRVSLTILIFHVFVFRELAIKAGLNNLLGEFETILFITAVICIMGFLSILWRRKNFKYSLEWLMRKISG